MTVLVADFEPGGARPTAAALVAAARERGAAFLALSVEDEEGAPQAFAGERRVATLARAASDASNAGVGLFLRLPGTLSIDDLGAALGVARERSAAESRERYLVVVRSERVGRRLRQYAPQFPSAYEIAADEPRRVVTFFSPNFRRASASADDLVLPWKGLAPARARRLVQHLRERGGRLWIAGVPEPEVAAATALGTAGVVVRYAL